MNIPKALLYSKTHEWVDFTDDNIAFIGITDYAQDTLGNIVYVDLPEVGDTLEIDESFGDIESVKAVSELISPVDGEVGEINEELLDSPEVVNEDPYESWLIKAENITNREELMDADEYQRFCEEEED